jgi:hypothetical protein
VIAISVLPINKETIVYGSNDYGRTIRNSEPVLFDSIKKIAKHLNLKQHTVSGTEICTPVDLEGHKSLVNNHSHFFLIFRMVIFISLTVLVFFPQFDLIQGKTHFSTSFSENSQK